MKHEVSDVRPPLIHGGEFALVQRSHPQSYLRALLTLATHPKRFEIAWDVESLQWFEKVWDEATIISIGQPGGLQEDCRHEANRYRFLANKLLAEEKESGETRIVIMDQVADWPHPKTIRRAIGLFDRAGIMSVQ